MAKKEPAFDPAIWQEMADLGWSALAIPEAAGGVGMSLVTAVTIAEEIGRSAMPTPLTSTLQSTYVLSTADNPSANKRLNRIVEGQAAGLAIQPADVLICLTQQPLSQRQAIRDGEPADPQKVDFLIVAAHGQAKHVCMQ